jgi:hypothetical protein
VLRQQWLSRGTCWCWQSHPRRLAVHHLLLASTVCVLTSCCPLLVCVRACVLSQAAAPCCAPQELGLLEDWAPKPREASQTIAWFQKRQADLQRISSDEASGSGSSKVSAGKKTAGGSSKVAVKKSKGGAASSGSSGSSSNGSDAGVKVPLWGLPAKSTAQDKGKVAPDKGKALSSRDSGSASDSHDEGPDGTAKVRKGKAKAKAKPLDLLSVFRQ